MEKCQEMASGDVQRSLESDEQDVLACSANNTDSKNEATDLNSNGCHSPDKDKTEGSSKKKVFIMTDNISSNWNNIVSEKSHSGPKNGTDDHIFTQVSVNGLNSAEPKSETNASIRPIHFNADTWSLTGDRQFSVDAGLNNHNYPHGAKCGSFHLNAPKINYNQKVTSFNKNYSSGVCSGLHACQSVAGTSSANVNVPSNGQHIVLLHVNPGETISFYMGDHMQLIQGPATVRMVSSNSSPPIPMPVQVPPGHMVQQIVDENGTLRHIILSPQPPVAVPIATSYTTGSSAGTATSADATGPSPFFVYSHHSYPQPMQFHSTMQSGLSNQGLSSSSAHFQPQQSSNVQGTTNQGHSHSAASQPNFNKDERTQKQFFKLKKRLEARQKEIVILTDTTTSKNADTGKNASEKTTAQEEKIVIKEDQLIAALSVPKVTEITARSALVKWTAPDLNLENAAKNVNLESCENILYKVLINDKGSEHQKKIAYCGSLLEWKLLDLKPACSYYVWLEATINDGQGKKSEYTIFKTQACKPEPPLPPKLLNRTKTSISLKWNAATDNGSKIVCYVLEYDEGNGEDKFSELFRGLQKQYKAVKLKASTCYKFRLVAVNEHGKSDYSDISCFSTSGSTPSQPLPPSLEQMSTTTISLQWQSRPNDDDFTLQMEDEKTLHGFLPVFNGKDTSYTCTGLQRKTTYRFRLCANNEEGSSPWSQVVVFTTLPDKPLSPGKPYVKGRVHSTYFKVTWDPPKDTGGSEVTQYNLEMDSSEGFEAIYSGSELEYQCEHLQPGSTYSLRACCISEGGTSSFSEPYTVQTLPVVPGKCQALRLFSKAKPSSLHLKWNHPEYNGGSEILDFEVEIMNPDSSTRQVYKGQGTDCVVAGLQPGRQYVFQVRAYNNVGHGPWSEALEISSGAGVPDAPNNVQIVPRSPHSVVVSWTEPLNNGAVITEYRLETCQNEKDFETAYIGVQLSVEIKSLFPATMYFFRVQAVNSVGPSSFSECVNCHTPPSSPGAIAVSNIKAISGATTIAISWKEPDNHGAPIINYNIEVGESIVTSVENPEICIEGLMPETAYRIRIQGANSIGVGPFSSMKVITRGLPPSSPVLECCGSSHNSLRLKWGDGKNPEYHQYTLEVQNIQSGSFSPVYQGTSHCHKISKLQEMTAYNFRIYASNNEGDGPYSTVYTFTTLKAVPPALKAPKVGSVTETSCIVEWMTAKSIGNDVLSYKLQMALKTSAYQVVFSGVETNFIIHGLIPNSEYSVRVAVVRHCTDGSGELCGPFSPSSVFSTSHPVSKNIPPKVVSAMSSLVDRQPLSDQQWAVIILCGFTFFAIFVAILIQWIFSYSKS